MRLSIIKKRVAYYAIASVLILISIVAGFVLPLNFGIDMTGGTQSEYDYTNSVDIAAVKADVESIKKTVLFNGKEVINTTSIYTVSGEKKFVVEAGFSRVEGLNDADFGKLKTEFKEKLSASKSVNGATLSKYVDVGESFGDYIKKTAYMTLALVIAAISCYIAYAFRGTIAGYSSFSFGVVTAASLFHDVIIAFGFYVIASAVFPEYKIDTFFITAMLTVLGYSINDTIVVMDRIRSNLRLPESRKMDLGVVIDNSINDTMARSLFTSLTVFLTLLAMFYFGPEAIKGFTLALLFGTIVGTYSSVFIAAPLLYDITKNKAVAAK